MASKTAVACWNSLAATAQDASQGALCLRPPSRPPPRPPPPPPPRVSLLCSRAPLPYPPHILAHFARATESQLAAKLSKAKRLRPVLEFGAQLARLEVDIPAGARPALLASLDRIKASTQSPAIRSLCARVLQPQVAGKAGGRKRRQQQGSGGAKGRGKGEQKQKGQQAGAATGKRQQKKQRRVK